MLAGVGRAVTLTGTAQLLNAVLPESEPPAMASMAEPQDGQYMSQEPAPGLYTEQLHVASSLHACRHASAEPALHAQATS